jgi:hypothetical protein
MTPSKPIPKILPKALPKPKSQHLEETRDTRVHVHETRRKAGFFLREGRPARTRRPDVVE